MKEKCSNCKGTGKQAFHGHFESVVGICNFCGGTGKRKDQIKWFENITSRCSGAQKLAR